MDFAPVGADGVTDGICMVLFMRTIYNISAHCASTVGKKV